jgi:hypothetical protein
MNKPKKRAPLSFSVDSVFQSVSRLPEESKQTVKEPNVQTKPGRAGRQFIAAHVPPEASKQFRVLAIQEGKTTQDLLVQAINDLFAKHGLSRIA